MIELPKYPRTFHLEGSKGIKDPDAIVPSSIAGKFLVVEEKMDGSMVWLAFDSNGKLLIGHRNQEVSGSEFDLLKSWAASIEEDLFDMLEDRYVMYGEWLWAKHTIFYDRLVHYFLEYDIYDRKENIWLDTSSRYDLLNRKHIVSVRILQAEKTGLSDLSKQAKSSAYISSVVKDNELMKSANVIKETDLSGLMEGLYIKVEENGRVVERYKYIRKGFLDIILGSGTHWKDRPVIINQLTPGARERIHGF
ncbi:MAG TPA: RNA ligase family protein [Anaerovoracaceae bacterium]|nr:RNA ligase family protein [Anaerovoracaceae bacterium]